ncbi:glycosyltransferase family 4 protein [Candidatus Kuenenbacteria bacterium]|nr:glycosyltransferase family 4 protein [Candidatus Kuenenbacteria bacterium]
MKIAQVVCHVPPQPGGLGMVAHSYADQLTERGHDVTLFVPRNSEDLKNGKRYKIVTLIPWFRVGLGAILPQLLWRLWSFDIVHLHYPFFGSSVLVAFLRKIKKVKLVISYHQDVHLRGWHGMYERGSRKIFLRFILRMADKIIVSSEDYVEDSNIQEYYFKNIGKFKEIPFGVPRRYKPAEKDSDLMKKYGFDSEDKIVLFVGGMGPNHYFKGVNYLIRAMSQIEDRSVKALIVGKGVLQKTYKKMAKKLNLENRVKFAGYVEDELMPKHFNLADIAILPSINSSEAFGIVLIEAMACGKPVLASNLKGVRSVVDPGINGLLVEPKNSRDIADKIKYLVEHPDKMKLFGDNCLKSVEEKYRWSVITNSLEKVYSNLMKK